MDGGARVKVHLPPPQRKKLKIGDRRCTKKHGVQIRVVEAHHGMWVCNGSRYRYEWKRPHELLGTQWDYLLTPQERASAQLRRDIEHSVLMGA
jgi:hypothetical protein